MTPAERAARILRATLRAREQMIDWREQQIEQLHAMLEIMAAEFGAEIDRLGNADGTLPMSAVDLLNRYIEQRMGEFDTAFRRVLMDGLQRSATMGAGVLGILPVQADAVAASAVRYVTQFVWADGLQLSDRLWRAGQGTRQVVRQHILGAIARGQAASTAALELLASGKPLLTEVAAGIEAGKAKSIKALVRRSLVGKERSQRFIYERLMRTEMNRAYTEAFVSAAVGDDDIVGVKFNLSPLHPKVDICDVHAKVDLYGLGPGVYPLNAHPYPAHPQTLSFLTLVFSAKLESA